MNLINKYLGEESKSKQISKGIFSYDGRKIMGARTGGMQLGFLNDDDTIDIVTWKQFKSSKLPWLDTQKKDDSYLKKEFLMALVKKIKQFNKKVDFNQFARGNVSFEDKVDWILTKGGVKYSKSGVK